jgi:hypothetical protein
MDSCGNQANVYNADMFKDKTNYNVDYWSFTPQFSDKVSSLVPSSTNAAESVSNGNCNYYLGSTCRKYDKTIDGAATNGKPPTLGDYICRSLDCGSGQFVSEFKAANNNRAPVNGETWCGTTTADSKGDPKITLGGNNGINGADFSDPNFNKSTDLPGSRDVRFVCYNGKVTVEPCADYRQEICQQSTLTGGYLSAQCVTNRWRDCTSQVSKTSCEDTSQRDCQWMTGVSLLKDSNGTGLVWDQQSDKLVPSTGKDDTNVQASCIPKYPPGFSSSEAQGLCAIANTQCYVVFGADVFSLRQAGGVEMDKTLDAGGYVDVNKTRLTFNKGYMRDMNNGDVKVVCLTSTGQNSGNLVNVTTEWLTAQKNLCYSLGDCGVSVNYLNKEGTNVDSDLYVTSKVNSTS